MCGLCGGGSTGPHWTLVAGGDGADRVRHRSASLRYARALLSVRGMNVREWQGRYVVENGRGRTVVVDDLSACWAAAELIAGGVVDPLDPASIAALTETAGR
jgi:hypothetical protein